MSEDVTINIRDIQHYMYCPRRFALLEVNDDWAENAFVVKANLLHENVHSGERNFENKHKIVRSDVSNVTVIQQVEKQKDTTSKAESTDKKKKN